MTAPAVNKWERGASCPDLALLAPLARLLGTDLNTLLSFREELTGEEICPHDRGAVRNCPGGGHRQAPSDGRRRGGRSAGVRNRYTYSLSMTLNGLIFTLAVEEPEPYKRRLEELNEALADSEDRDVRDQALHLLIGRT